MNLQKVAVRLTTDVPSGCTPGVHMGCVYVCVWGGGGSDAGLVLSCRGFAEDLDGMLR